MPDPYLKHGVRLLCLVILSPLVLTSFAKGGDARNIADQLRTTNKGEIDRDIKNFIKDDLYKVGIGVIAIVSIIWLVTNKKKAKTTASSERKKD